MKYISYAVLILGIIECLIIGTTLSDLLISELLMVIIIVTAIYTILLFVILFSIATILEKMELEEEYQTKTLTTILNQLNTINKNQ